MTNLTIPFSGFLDTLFRGTWIQVSILGFPAGGYKITLIDLIILAILAIAVNGIVEALTGRKAGSTLLAILITLLGAILVVTFVRLPFDFAIEGLRIVASLLGAVVIATFYTLLRGKAGKSGSH